MNKIIFSFISSLLKPKLISYVSLFLIKVIISFSFPLILSLNILIFESYPVSPIFILKFFVPFNLFISIMFLIYFTYKECFE